MKEPDVCRISYCGFNNPNTSQEVDFEILGLRVLIKQAEQRIATLNQTRFLADTAISNNFSELKDMFSEDKNENS
jgi:hypothetical protein